MLVVVKRNAEELEQPVAAAGKISAVLLLVYCLGLPNSILLQLFHSLLSTFYL